MTRSTKGLIVSLYTVRCMSACKGQSVPGSLWSAFRTANTASSLPAIAAAQSLRQEAMKSNATVTHAGDNEGERKPPRTLNSVSAAAHRCNISRCRLRSNWTLEALLICTHIYPHTHISITHPVVHDGKKSNTKKSLI